MSDECDDPKCACHQLAWMKEMERVEQEVFPDARPRGEVIVRLSEPVPCPDCGHPDQTVCSCDWIERNENE